VETSENTDLLLAFIEHWFHLNHYNWSMERPIPLVSILIPAYGVSSYIGETLESVFTQKFSGEFEVVLVNDGSSDTEDLEKAIAPFRSRIVYHSQSNGGPPAARNAAFRLSRAPLIALLDGDDVYLPDYLEVQAKLLTDDPDLSVVYGDMEVFGGSSVDGGRLSELNHEREAPSLESLIRATATVINTSMVRREAIVEAGGWDESLRRCEDYDLWLRIAAKKRKFKRHSQVIARYRVRGDSLSANHAKMFEARMQTYLKLLDNADLPQGMISVLRERINDTTGDIAFALGKDAFRNRNFALAAQQLRKAADSRKSKRLSLIASLVEFSPNLLYTLTLLRSRLLSRYRNL
jgi:glycosyltransferase involved in cell wall biosynthesis